jgi:peptide/nickel transport system permease protein
MTTRSPNTRLGRFMSRRSAVIGLAVLGGFIVLAVLAPWIAPKDPQSMDLNRLLASPSVGNWLGTDENGRDVLSRLIAGSRIDLTAAALSTMLAAGIGIPLGLLVGFAPKGVDLVVMRVVEAVQSLPGIVVLTSVIAIVGRGIGGATIALGIALSLLILFVTRSEVRLARNELYASSARVMGVSPATIVVRHIVPNIVPALVAVVTTVFGICFIALSGLSSLGLGAQPPEPSWGAMLLTASQNMNRQFFAVFPPGIAIMIVGLAAGAVAEGVQFAFGRGAAPVSSAFGGNALASNLPVAATNTTQRGSASNGSDRPDSTGPVLALEDLVVFVPATPTSHEIPLVRGIDLTIGRGEILGLVGESGSGKTMTVSAITGLLPTGVASRAATLSLDGKDLRTLSKAELRTVLGTRLGMIFQNPLSSLDPTKRVGPQLNESVLFHGTMNSTQATARALELLKEVGINDPRRVSEAWPHELSGGMAQRVMIASALMPDPLLLLADEPTTALDVTVQAQVLDLLREVARFGTSMLFITHDLAVVADLCDRVAVMQHGVIVETGTTETLFRSPSHDYTKVLLDVAGVRGYESPGHSRHSGHSGPDDRSMTDAAVHS